MTEQLISFETVKLAESKGFPWLQDRYSMSPDGVHFYKISTQSLLQKWLRSKGIHIELLVDGWGDDNCVSNEVYYRAFVWKTGEPKPGPADDLGGSYYERILETALEYGLNLL
jgi:hypothetical protein